MLKSYMHDHVAYATSNTDETAKIFHILGFKNKLFYRQKLDKFDVCITKLASETGDILELVEPVSENSVVSRMLKNQEATIYHSAFFTENLLETLQHLQSAGAVIISRPMSIPYPATPAHVHYKTSHVFHKSIGLFEITGP